MHGAKRVVAFCLMTAVLPAALIILPLYLRHSVFADVTYKIFESDIMEVNDGISTIFCEKHSLKMNSSFNAFQINQRPEISTNRKHIRLKKSMSLPDDTMEYWGFYLLKGARVQLTVCSRYNGSRLMVVEGEQVLQTCGILDHNLKKYGSHIPPGFKGNVFVTFETEAEVINAEFSAEETARKQRAHFEQHTGVSSSTTSKTVMSLTTTTTATTTTTTSRPIDNVQPDEESLRNHAREEIDDDFYIDEQGRRLKKPDLVQPRKRKPSFTKTEETVDRRQMVISEEETERQIRHKNHHHRMTHRPRVPSDEDELTVEEQWRNDRRRKRDLVLDRRVYHGGNANKNFTDRDDSESASSFENSLLTCYDGRQVAAPRKFTASPYCTNVDQLSQNKTPHTTTVHEVTKDGYYYYIFYSDNDDVQNSIHAIFDIYKPTYQYANIPESKGCINSTECSFPLQFLSDETVIVEVPTRDGIESEDDDFTFLVSTCHPRVGVYVIFPIAVLFLILSCAFL